MEHLLARPAAQLDTHYLHLCIMSLVRDHRCRHQHNTGGGGGCGGKATGHRTYKKVIRRRGGRPKLPLPANPKSWTNKPGVVLYSRTAALLPLSDFNPRIFEVKKAPRTGEGGSRHIRHIVVRCQPFHFFFSSLSSASPPAVAVKPG